MYFAGCTPHPTKAWVTQQARQMVWQLEERETPMRFLIHDRDTKFTQSLDTMFMSEKLKIIRTPYRAPNANAFAERWVRTVREECLDKLIIIEAVEKAWCLKTLTRCNRGKQNPLLV
jgi:putative transposase